MSSVIALAYVGVRTTVRDVASIFRKPANLFVACLVLGGLVFLISLGGSKFQGMSAPIASLGSFIAALSLVLTVGLVLLASSARCPLRLRGPDVTWLFPAPGSSRGIIVYKVTSRVFSVFLAGIAAASISAVRVGTLDARVIMSALGFALLAGALRSFSYIVHFAVVRGVPLLAIRVVALMLLGIPLGRFLVTSGDPFGPGAELRLFNAFAFMARPLAYLAQPLFAALNAHAVGGPLLALLLLYAGLALVAIGLGTGYQDGAARITWETETLTAAMKGTRPSDLAWRPTTTIPSLSRFTSLTGDWAFLWRALAQFRREARREAASNGPLVGLSLAAALWAPGLTIVPLIVAAIGGVLRGILEGMAEELGRSHVLMVPGRARSRVTAIVAVPALRLALALVLTSLPVAIRSPLPLWVRVTALIAAVPAAAAVVLSNALAAELTRTPGMRIVLSSLIVSTWLGGAIAIGWWVRFHPLVSVGLVVGVCVTAALFLHWAAARGLRVAADMLPFGETT